MVTTTQHWKRVINLYSGVAMVVTDLHGDWDAYERYRDRFLSMHAHGKAEYLIFCGDLIHHADKAQDRSLQIVRDLLRLQANYGDRVLYLLGNHELPHIYSITLQKGKQMYTPPFEAALGQHRRRVLTLFRQLPFFVRTVGGVAISHSGASPALNEESRQTRLFNLSHQRIWRETAESLPQAIRPSLRQSLGQSHNRPYDQLVRDYFAVSGPGDPRYDNFLIGAVASTSHPDFHLLWEMLFTRNELQFEADAYRIILDSMLGALSRDFAPQRVLVSGHIDCAGGHKVVSPHQLRVASAHHAQPREAGQYLLFDVAKQAATAEELAGNLHSVFA
jgi:hypothetical protein